MKKWMAIPVLAGTVALGGMAIAANAEKGDSVTPAEYLTMDEAKAKAVESVGGQVKGIEFDREKSGAKYEVEVYSDGVEYNLDIDAKTGEVLRTKKDDNDDDDDQSRFANEKVITAEEAIAIAMKQAQGQVMEVELDEDDGRLQYDIEIEDGTYEYELEIDAITGKVLDFEKERDDD